VDWPIDETHADDTAPASLELAAVSAPAGSRVLFGDPVLVVPVSAPRRPPAARIVVALVLSGVEPSRFPPRIEEGSAPNLTELLRGSAEFQHHRSPTTVSSGVMASLLTGLPPRIHLVEDGGARLSDELTTIGSAARDGSVQTAMFTGSPATFAAFGFARGWDKFASYSPVSGAAAVAPIADAGKWLVEHVKDPADRALVLIHARGGHPPWDVTPADAAKLPPFDYSGSMEPRRSAELLAKARNPGTHFRLSDGDRTRMWATYEAAMGGNDRAVGALIDSLKKHDLWQDAMFIVTGDVGVDPANKAPFGDGEDLAEGSLSTPLWIKFPKGELGGLKVQSPTGAMDIGKTILGALGLEPPREFGGNDLFQLATGAVLADLVPSIATLDLRYATRWGNRVLAGTAGKSPALCVLARDPSCEHDASEELPFAAESLFRFTYEAITQASRPPLRRTHGREPATLDADTAAALTVWGQVETKFAP
jgi:arylsulfatase A-like enzyme